MNIAFFLKPKVMTAYVYEDSTVRQALEKMKYHGYAAIPVIDKDGGYAGSVSEGDFLWAIYNQQDPHFEEKTKVKELLVNKPRREPVRIDAGMDELLLKVIDKNYVSVVDDFGSFIGIVTRGDIMKYYYEKIKILEGEALND